MREKMTGPLDKVCPFCNAAIGAKCLEKVKDGSRWIEYFHPERVVADVRSTER